MSSLQLDEVTWDALKYLSKRLGIDPSALARDLLRPMVQYLRYYIAQTDIAEICKDVIDISSIPLPRARTLDVDVKMIRDYILKPASILIAIRETYGKFPSRLDLKEIYSVMARFGISSKEANNRLKKLAGLGFIKIDGDLAIFDRAPEILNKFLDCAAKLERMYGLRSLTRVIGKGVKT